MRVDCWKDCTTACSQLLFTFKQHNPMPELKCGCGIDLAKDKFNCCLSVIDTSQQVRICAQSAFANSPSGFEAFLAWTCKHAPKDIPLVFVLEATGIYYEQFAWYLHNQDLPVSVVLPNKARKYKDSLGLKSKNDKIDAQALAFLCCERQLPCWKPLSKNLYGLRMLTRQIESLGALKTLAGNQLHALRYGMYRDPATEQLLADQISLYQTQKQGLERRVRELLASDQELKAKFDKILTIKGLGLQTLAVLVAETNGFATFENAAQLVSYAGYDVIENQSGNRRGKTKISKQGNGHIRRALFFPAFNMRRYQIGNLAALYERVFERTRQKMKGYVAVQKKLLVLVYTLWKRDETFNPQYLHSAAAAHRTSGDTEVVPSLAKAEGQAKQIENKQQTNDPEIVIPAINTGITLDRHPSKHRRTPSLAKPNLIRKT